MAVQVELKLTVQHKTVQTVVAVAEQDLVDQDLQERLDQEQQIKETMEVKHIQIKPLIQQAAAVEELALLVEVLILQMETVQTVVMV